MIDLITGNEKVLNKIKQLKIKGGTLSQHNIIKFSVSNDTVVPYHTTIINYEIFKKKIRKLNIIDKIKLMENTENEHEINENVENILKFIEEIRK